MSRYRIKMNEARNKDLSRVTHFSGWEGAAYVGVSLNTFRAFADRIGCKRKIFGRTVYLRSVIDEALERGDAI